MKHCQVFSALIYCSSLNTLSRLLDLMNKINKCNNFNKYTLYFIKMTSQEAVHTNECDLVRAKSTWERFRGEMCPTPTDNNLIDNNQVVQISLDMTAHQAKITHVKLASLGWHQ